MNKKKNDMVKSISVIKSRHERIGAIPTFELLACMFNCQLPVFIDLLSEREKGLIISSQCLSSFIGRKGCRERKVKMYL
jgi:hypothetical protein